MQGVEHREGAGEVAMTRAGDHAPVLHAEAAGIVARSAVEERAQVDGDEVALAYGLVGGHVVASGDRDATAGPEEHQRGALVVPRRMDAFGRQTRDRPIGDRARDRGVHLVLAEADLGIGRGDGGQDGPSPPAADCADCVTGPVCSVASQLGPPGRRAANGAPTGLTSPTTVASWR